MNGCAVRATCDGKAIISRERARQDIEEALEYPVGTSCRWLAALCLGPRLPDLRALLVSQYPYLIFYLERPGHIDVWRVLHGKRNVPAWLREES